MRKVFDALPGPTVAKVVVLVILVLVVLFLLGILFEWAGDLLDDGGTIGT